MSKAKLPALSSVTTGNSQVDRWIQSVTEILQVREGARGDKLEQVLTRRDVADLGLDTSKWVPVSGDNAKGVLVQKPDGGYALVSIDALSESIRKTRLYQDLSLRIDDAARFDDTPDRIKAILLRSLADEAAQRSADVSRLDQKIQTATDSLAYSVQEVTAAVSGSVAGVRETAYAAATESSATAGHVTQLTAALDGTGAATIEDSFVVIADRTTGLRSQAMLKLNAGRAVAGVGLLASEDPSGTTTSAFLVQADQFALISTINFTQESTPTATVIGQTWYIPSTKTYKRATATGAGSWVTYVPSTPFGVDTTTGEVTINGSLRINSAAGAQIQDAGATMYTWIAYANDAAGSTGFSTTWTSQTYVGFAYNKTVSTPSSTPGDYAWSLIKGANGSNGSNGTRGTIITKITGAWNSSTAAAQVQSVANAAGATPNYPIKGDIVNYTGGAYECSVAGYPGTWAAVAAYIDGSLIVTGSLSAAKISSGAISADVSIASSGSLSADGSLTVQGINPASAVTVIGTLTNIESSAKIVAASNSVYSISYRVGVHAKASSTNAAVNIGVVGEATNASSALTGYGVVGSGTNCGGYFESVLYGGTALYCTNTAGGQAFWSDGPSKFTGAIQALSSINAVGEVTAYGSSDKRLKKNIKRITGALEKLERINGVMFDWKAKVLKDAGGVDGFFVREHDTGVIAQEVQAVMPEIVGERPDGTLAVKYEKLTPLLIEAIKELTARVRGLEAR